MSSGENERLAGRYRIVRRLGRGGMGVVWLAVDEVLGREVAVKELRTFTDAAGPELDELRVRLSREARAAARVSHPGVVAVHDVAEHEGRPFVVMERVDGPSLDDVLAERGVLDPPEAARIGANVLEALAAAHAVGVLHRDVKPGNILLDRSGRVALTDFGIAALENPGDGSATRLTRSGEIIGSLDYLAPERAQGRDAVPASDVWAVGVTLYAAVEGSTPFRRPAAWSTLNAIVTDPVPGPRRAGPLTEVLLRLLAKDPGSRPDASEAARLLTAVAQAPGPEAARHPERTVEATDARVTSVPPAGAPEAGPPPASRSAGPRGGRTRARALLAASAAVLALAGAGVTYGMLDRDSSDRTSVAATDGSEGPARTRGPKSGPASPSGAPEGTRPPSPDASTDPQAPSGEALPPGGASPSAQGCATDGTTATCEVLHTAPSSRYDGTEAGSLHAGPRAFQCQVGLPRSESSGGDTSAWWARTDVDGGVVYVNAVHLRGGTAGTPVPGLPMCGPGRT
ncbi:protein kinase [Streptomyces sp. NPDC048577]|uniref:protein kinase domain-containing protein n=1 Tax=Streptomyces sp. NPDC048577 TaxID=3157209 RepID=UPI00342986BB